MSAQLTIAGSEATFVDVRRGPAVAAVAGLAPGVRIIGLTMGQFSLLDLILAVLDKTGPADVWLSTWTAGIRDVRGAGVMLDAGKIRKITLLVDRSFPSRQRAYCAAMRRVFGDECIRTTRTHAKIAILRNERWSITIRSSMNLNRNPRVEQFDLDDDPRIADFFQAHFDEMGAVMPEGPVVPTAKVDAVFDRLRRGLNPFACPSDELLAKAGLPTDVAELASYLGARLSNPRALADMARRVGSDLRTLRAAIHNPTASSLGLLEDAAWELTESK